MTHEEALLARETMLPPVLGAGAEDAEAELSKALHLELVAAQAVSTWLWDEWRFGRLLLPDELVDRLKRHEAAHRRVEKARDRWASAMAATCRGDALD